MQLRQKQLYELASDSLGRDDIRQAVAACRELNVRFPGNFDGWRIAGEIHLKLNKPEAALVSTERALSLRPDDASVMLQRVDALIGLERSAEAKELLMSVANSAHGKAGIHDQIGRLLSSFEMHEDALVQYEKAVSLQPANASLHYNVATAQRFLGMIDDAEKSLNQALRLNEFDYEAHAMRSSLRKQSPQSNHIGELRRILDDDRLPEHGKVNICYALAKEYDDFDEITKSFSYLKRGADNRRSAMTYEVETDIEIIGEIRSSYTTGLLRSGESGHDSDEAIFIIGLPRTGTTLVERILGNHSSVHAAGELDNFGREMMRQLGEQQDLKRLSRRQVVKLCTELDFERLGRDYINSTRPLTGHTPRFIDKLPFNYLYAAAIHLALPHARIINMTRHPMATCYAIYKQLFRDAYPFSYSLEDLGRYFVAYHEVMTHWHVVMPGVMHTIAYEDVVENLESEAKRMVDYCGLPWEATCLDFHTSKQASTTASASQVRQPVYSSSLARWRRYEKELRPLARIFREAGIDI